MIVLRQKFSHCLSQDLGRLAQVGPLPMQPSKKKGSHEGFLRISGRCRTRTYFLASFLSSDLNQPDTVSAVDL